MNLIHPQRETHVRSYCEERNTREGLYFDLLSLQTSFPEAAISEMLDQLDDHYEKNNEHVHHEVRNEDKGHDAPKGLLAALLKTSLKEQHEAHKSQHAKVVENGKKELDLALEGTSHHHVHEHLRVRGTYQEEENKAQDELRSGMRGEEDEDETEKIPL